MKQIHWQKQLIGLFVLGFLIFLSSCNSSQTDQPNSGLAPQATFSKFVLASADDADVAASGVSPGIQTGTIGLYLASTFTWPKYWYSLPEYLYPSRCHCQLCGH